MVILVIDGWGISCEIALIWLLVDFTWFRSWLGAVRQQAITWANFDPDLCRQMASLGHNELMDLFDVVTHIPQDHFDVTRSML